MAGDSSTKLPQSEHNRESGADGGRENRPRDLRRVPGRTRPGAAGPRPHLSSDTTATTEAPPPRPALEPIPLEVAEELLRTFLQSRGEFLRGQPLLQLLLSAHARQGKSAEEEQVRAAKRRGGLRKDPVRQAVVARIVKLMGESDELETAREVWDALRHGQRRLGRDLTIEVGSDLDVNADKFDGFERIIITSLSGPVKIVTFQTFRSYVREARTILNRPAR